MGPDDNDSLLFSAAHTTKLGYTGHEHLDNVGLIHMNGRVYDPIIGRFISPDPLVPSPESSQGLNRYTYVNNNPLSYTDPSGHIALSTVAYIASAVLITAGEVFDEPLLTQVGFAVLAAAIGPEAWYQASAIGFGAGFTASGGDLEAGIYSALAATAFYGVGSAYADGGVATDVADSLTMAPSLVLSAICPLILAAYPVYDMLATDAATAPVSTPRTRSAPVPAHSSARQRH